MEISRKFLIGVILIIALISCNIVSAAVITEDVILNKNIKIVYNEKIQGFKNADGEIIYPISYEGTTYLPIRSISSMFEIELFWNDYRKSIYLGRGILDKVASEEITEFVPGTNENIKAFISQDIKIYFDNKIQKFKDVNENVVYPLSYNDATYLPIRAIAKLYNADIEWNAKTSTITIRREGNKVTEKEEPDLMGQGALNSKVIYPQVLQIDASAINWSGKFISTIDGYMEVELTPSGEGVEVYFKGYKNGKQVAARDIAKKVGGKLVLEKEHKLLDEKIEIRMKDSKLIVTVPEGECTVFAGEYFVDDGKVKTIQLSNARSITGFYKKDNANLFLHDFTPGKLDVYFSGVSPDGLSVFMISSSDLDYNDGVAGKSSERFDEKYFINLTVNEDSIYVESYSTDLNSVYNKINGVYKLDRKGLDFEDCKNKAYGISVSAGVYHY